MNLKRQLLLVSVLTLMLPWAGCEFIRETEVALQGASSLGLTGTGGNADVSGKGASTADLGGFTVANARIKLEGASNASINTDGVLDVDLAGSSDVRYLGEPTLGDVKMRGDSTLERGG